MSSQTKVILAALGGIVGLAGVTLAVGRRPSAHATQPSPLGAARGALAMEAVIDQPGPIEVETVVGADWQVDRQGLIDLDAPAAKQAGLQRGPEPIRIFFHALRHPTRGLFLIDSGVERQIGVAPTKSALGWLAARAMHAERMKVKQDLAGWLARQPAPPAGVFLTHLHVDHLLGLPDLAATTPIYAGPGETTGRAALNLVTAPIVDRDLEGKGPILEWPFQPDGDGRFAGVLDVFGDATLWAIWVPGHTPGSTAFVARTPKGPVLLTGDACHTRWGWDHEVAPGTYSADRKRGGESLRRLEELARRHPRMAVRLGHQD